MAGVFALGQDVLQEQRDADDDHRCEILGQFAASLPPQLSASLPAHARLAPDGMVSERSR